MFRDKKPRGFFDSINAVHLSDSKHDPMDDVIDQILHVGMIIFTLSILTLVISGIPLIIYTVTSCVRLDALIEFTCLVSLPCSIIIYNQYFAKKTIKKIEHLRNPPPRPTKLDLLRMHKLTFLISLQVIIYLMVKIYFMLVLT